MMEMSGRNEKEWDDRDDWEEWRNGVSGSDRRRRLG